uniref:Splicing factor, arginine/serine-rich 15 n=1 Tax=Cacopsylla melanoneura TaxID=428564 RepID=A0A8D8PUY4_9HEMI
MNRRQDAAKALHKLKNTKLQGKTITLAWAPGKGMKDKDWKDFWEVQDGVSYIPYDRLSKDIDYDYLEDGGVFDEDTVPLWLKDHLKSIRKKQEDEAQNDTETPTVSSTKGDVLPSSGASGSEVPPGFIPLPDGPLPSAPEREKGSTPGPVTSIAMPLAPMPTVSQSNSTSLPPGLGTHLLMPPFGLPRLLGPMGMAMGPAGLMSNVPLGVPPPGLYKVHQQLLNRMPPPGNVFNQNMGEFPDGMLPLPFGLQHLQSALQQQQQQQHH